MEALNDNKETNLVRETSLFVFTTESIAMTKQDIEKHKALIEKIEKAVNESNLEDKWKYIINSMFETNHLCMESDFLCKGGSLK